MQKLMKSQGIAFSISALLLLGVYFRPILVLAAEPRELVEKFHSALIFSMKASRNTDIVERYKRLEQEIEKAFEIRFMVQLATGLHWKRTSDKEKSSLIDAFRNMSVSTYVSRFNSYSGQQFTTLGVRDGPRGIRLVDTQIESPGHKPVRLTYVTRKFSVGWKIIDVLLDAGISEMAMRVSEYRAVLRAKGTNALAAALNRKAATLLKK